MVISVQNWAYYLVLLFPDLLLVFGITVGICGCFINFPSFIATVFLLPYWFLSTCEILQTCTQFLVSEVIIKLRQNRLIIGFIILVLWKCEEIPTDLFNYKMLISEWIFQTSRGKIRNGWEKEEKEEEFQRPVAREENKKKNM